MKPFNLTLEYSPILREFFAYMLLETWDNLHTPSARWFSLLWLAHVGMRILWRYSFIELCPSSGSHKHFAPCLGGFNWSKVFVGDKNVPICVSLPPNIII